LAEDTHEQHSVSVAPAFYGTKLHDFLKFLFRDTEYHSCVVFRFCCSTI